MACKATLSLGKPFMTLGLFPFEVPSLHFWVFFFCSPHCSAPNIPLFNPSTVWKLVGGPDISKVYLWEWINTLPHQENVPISASCPSAPACKIMKGIARHAVYSFEFGTNCNASMLFFSKPCLLTRASETSSELSQYLFVNMDANALQASIVHMLVLPPHTIDIWMYMQCRSEPYSWKINQLQGTDEDLS